MIDSRDTFVVDENDNVIVIDILGVGMWGFPYGADPEYALAHYNARIAEFDAANPNWRSIVDQFIQDRENEGIDSAAAIKADRDNYVVRQQLYVANEPVNTKYRAVV